MPGDGATFDMLVGYRVRVTERATPDIEPVQRTRSVRSVIETVVICAVFALYLVFLFKLLLFSREPGSESSLNLVPFGSVVEYYFGDSSATRRFAFANVIGNVIAFVPVGAYLAVLRSRSRIWVDLLIVVAVSVSVEIIQGAFALGASDIDDVILNTLGGLLGILFVKLLGAILRKHARVRTAMAVLSLVALPILCYYLFVIRLRM